MQNKILITVLSVIVAGGMWFYYKVEGVSPELAIFNQSDTQADREPVETDEGYGVSASNPLAVEAGMEVLEKGGSAADAAVTVSYVLSVVEPYGSGIGGGGETLYHPADGEPITYVYNENAPLNGEMPEDNVGLPGFVKGMETLNADLGNLEMSELIQPAIDIAEEGFAVDNSLHGRLKAAQYRMPISDLPHLYPGGTPVNPGVEIKQEALADTLKVIRDGGAESFYNDQLGQNFLANTSGHTEQDLTQYEVKTAAPAMGSFAGYDVITAPPPFGGTTLIQSLNMVEDLDLEKAAANDQDYIHLLGEVIKRSYSDRLSNISDPEFNQINVDEMTSDAYAAQLAEDISLSDLSEDYEINDSPADEADHDNTTHFVIVDKEGNMASTTNTLSNFFGSGKFVDGYFLNNQLSNFSETPGSVNAPEPGKSPRSYTSPTILAKDGQPVMGIGTPGGKRIPMMITDVLTRHLLLDEPLEDVVEAPRFYVEEEEVIMEEAFADSLDEDVKQQLQAKGYTLDTYNSDQFYGAIHSLVIDREEGFMYGAADSRRAGDWQIKEN
ncbi:gamma-glutamyltranspeptidase [Halobacillus andaensis]|uniref:Gamma-glutamyltranspeptidase n=1 Tax=Halobacillus andaensis TaxID=1176239 RepID=A0A917EVU3_HALAA|nr:gamma-glutamyltransferase [Halobacillus andaensis]MBP2004372.1 gamma-glutamyltranspeptidase/glutathione hydrolase [Halobacillus andaensis]GGF22114.1 gamma-glutamyltranspeptidase [Halobacillus andaensis]